MHGPPPAPCHDATSQTQPSSHASTVVRVPSSPTSIHSTASTDRPQIQFRFPPPQHRLPQGMVNRRLQMWVLLQQCKGLLPRLLEYIGIPHQVCDPKLRYTPLPESKKLTGPADTEILFGNDKSVGRSHERIQPLPSRRCRFAGCFGLCRSKQHTTRSHE